MRHLGDVDKVPPRGGLSPILRVFCGRRSRGLPSPPMELVSPVDAPVQSSVSIPPAATQRSLASCRARSHRSSTAPAAMSMPGAKLITFSLDAFSGRGIVRPVAARFAGDDDLACLSLLAHQPRIDPPESSWQSRKARSRVYSSNERFHDDTKISFCGACRAALQLQYRDDDKLTGAPRRLLPWDCRRPWSALTQKSGVLAIGTAASLPVEKYPSLLSAQTCSSQRPNGTA
jgi:hypothetical protein